MYNFDSAVCFIDCETGGELDGEHQLIEIAAIRVENDGTSRSYDTLVKPKRPISADSSAVHQLRSDDFGDAVDRSIAMDRLLETAGDATWIIYNAPFDLGVIRSHMNARQLESAKSTVVIDAFRVAAKVLPDAESHKLHSLYHAFGIEREPRIHRAINDARITRAVCEILAERAGIRTTQEMLEFSLDPVPVTKMKFGKHAGQQLSEVPDDYIEWWLFRRNFGDDENFDLNYSMAQEWSRRGKSVGLEGYQKAVVAKNYQWTMPFA